MHLRRKIDLRMDMVQRAMETNHHLDNKEAVLELIDSVSKFWSVLSEEDRDYIHCARDAVEEERKWNV